MLSSAIPYTVELEALRRLPERVFGVLLSLEPAVAAIVGLSSSTRQLSAARSSRSRWSCRLRPAR